MESNNGGKQLLYAGQLTLKQRGLLGGHTSVYVHLYPYRLDVLTSSPERDGSEPRPTSDLRFSLDLTRISQLKVKCSGGNLQIRVWVAGDKHVLCAPDVQSFAAWVQRFKFYLLEEEVRADLDVRQLLSGSAIDVTQAQEARGWSLVDTHAPRTAAEEITSERVPDEDGEWELLSGPSASAPASASVTNTYAHSTTDASDDAKCREGEHSEVLDIPQARRSARQVAGVVQRLFCARTEVPSTRVFSSNGIGACQTAKSVKRFCRAGGAMDLRDVREVILRTLLIKTGRPRDMPSNEEFAGICARYLALHTETLGAAFASHDNNRVPRNFTHAMPAFSTKAFDWGLDSNPMLLHDASHRLSCQCLCALMATHWPQLMCTPYVIDLVVLLRAFLSECETWLCVWSLLTLRTTNSSNDHFTFAEYGFHALADSFVQAASTHCVSVVDKLTECNIDVKALFESWTLDFFATLLDPYARLRVLLCFLCEGTKVLIRVGLGIFKCYKGALLCCASEDEVLEALAVLPSLEIESVLEAGFAVPSLKRKNITKDMLGSVMELKKQISEGKELKVVSPNSTSRSYAYTLPRITRNALTSKVLSAEAWFFVYSALPARTRCMKPRRVFYSGEDGYSGEALGAAVGKQTCFVALSCADGGVVGVFLRAHGFCAAAETDDNYSHHAATGFVCSFDPQACRGCVYRVGMGDPSAQRACYMGVLRDDGCLCVGGRSGYALQLDYKLKTGEAHPCADFDGLDVPLVATEPAEGGTFNVVDAEVWVFEDGDDEEESIQHATSSPTLAKFDLLA